MSSASDPGGLWDDGIDPAVRCADCEKTDGLANDLDPVDQMPIPADALAGFPDGVPQVKRHDRKSFLRNGAIGMASVYAASKLDWTRAFEAAQAEAAVSGSKLCVIFLNGGWDGLNVICPQAPAGFDTYRAERPGIHRVPGPSVPGGQVGMTEMPGTGGFFGWSNKMIAGPDNNTGTLGMDSLWGDGSGGPGSNVAAWLAADYTPPNRSHFESRDYWFSGTLDPGPTGWLGRWLDAYGSPDNPLQAVSIGSRLSKEIVTKSAPVSAIRGLQGVDFRVNGVGSNHVNTTELMDPVSASKAGAGNEQLGHTKTAYQRTVEVSRKVKALENAPLGTGYPDSSLSNRLQLAAVLMAANLGTRITTVHWGSFDTHADQLNNMDPQLETLSQALPAFQADLAARGIGDKTLTLVWSEFGRRVAQNDNGTDHGAGGLMMALGPMVRGGIHGDWPGLTDLVRGDLRPTTDYRSVYSSCIGEWLGGDPGAILPGGPFPAQRSLIR